MSKIGTSGHQGAGAFETAGDASPREQRPRPGFDDRSRGAGGRQAALKRDAGRDGPATTAGPEGARADAFGLSLRGALAKRAEGDSTADTGRRHGGPSTDAEISALLAGLSGPVGPLTAPPPSTKGEAGRERGSAGGRHTDLKALWAHRPEPDGAVDPSRAPARPGEAPAERRAAERAPEEPKRVLHLLAEVDPASLAGAGAAPAPLPPPGAATLAAPDGASPVPGTAERVERVADRVAQAIRAEEAPAPGQSITLEIPLDAGPHKLTVTLSGTEVSLVLARDAGGATSELVGAAKALVDGLQRRFPNRAIRVYDAVRPSAVSLARAGMVPQLTSAPESDDL